MNKLWVYGCSFSEPFGLETNPLPLITEDLNQCRVLTAEYWGTHLANKLGLECITRSRSGKGWNYITCAIDQDVRMWSKEDIIIISPSFFSRVSIMEFIDPYTREELLKYYKSWDDIAAFNQRRWMNSILNYQYFGYNVFTWLVEDATTIPPNTILAPENTTSNKSNWYYWIREHHKFWTTPPNESTQGDWHFNPQGHIAVADRMYDVINSTLINNRTL